MMQLRGGLEKQEIDVRAMHTIQLLAESLE
jgi:Fe-S oxidoreductase